MRIHHPQIGKPEIAHGTGGRADVERIARGHEHHAQTAGFNGSGQACILRHAGPAHAPCRAEDRDGGTRRGCALRSRQPCAYHRLTSWRLTRWRLTRWRLTWRLLPGGDHQIARAGKPHTRDLAESGCAHPIRVFRFAVTVACLGADQHIQRKERGELRRSLLAAQG